MAPKTTKYSSLEPMTVGFLGKVVFEDVIEGSWYGQILGYRCEPYVQSQVTLNRRLREIWQQGEEQKVNNEIRVMGPQAKEWIPIATDVGKGKELILS